MDVFITGGNGFVGHFPAAAQIELAVGLLDHTQRDHQSTAGRQPSSDQAGVLHFQLPCNARLQ